MNMLETPSRIWRRIEAVEGKDMPSLPSLSHVDDSRSSSSHSDDNASILALEHEDDSLPITSTPAALSHHVSASTTRAPSSSSSAARFASSLASRSTLAKSYASAGKSSQGVPQESFDASDIPSLPDDHRWNLGREVDGSRDSVPEMYLPPEDGDEDEDVDGFGGLDGVSLVDALEPVSRTSSPFPPAQDESMGTVTPQKKYDYSVSLRSEPKASPFDKYKNVVLRKPVARTRTPSLTRTVSSPSSSSANSTPQSTRSIPLPESNPASPVPGNSALPRSRMASPTVLPQDEPVQEESPSVEEIEPQEDETGELSYQYADLTTIEEETPSQAESHESQEPTFSFDGRQEENPQDTPGRSVPFSSPAPSSVFTPTPAARPRFAVPATNTQSPPTPRQYDDQAQMPRQPQHDDDDDDDPLVTPHTRRRSFLLDVINSTARPQRKFPTPHPRKGADGTGDGAKLPSAFPSAVLAGGATPRPRPRMSHPLAQTYVPSETDESGEDERPNEPAPVPSARVSRRASSGASQQQREQQPYDSDRASFVSTASSHDLTTHQRINTSFDPVLSMGGGHGVGRFNAGKLNAYLHGLNRRLQEENETLLARLRRVEVDGPAARGDGDGARTRRSSSVRLLGDVKEEGEEDETKALARGEETFLAEKRELERVLEEERAARARDKERWKARMGEVEKGVEAVVRGLEERVVDAESRAVQAEEARADAEGRAEDAARERTMAMERASKAERALESGRELGGELREANDRVDKIMGDLANANKLVRDLEGEVLRSDGRVDELEQHLEDAGRREEDVVVEVRKLQKQVSAMEEAAAAAEAEHQATKAYAAELEEDAAAAVERIESLEAQLADARETIMRMDQAAAQTVEKTESLDRSAKRAAERVRQLEEAIDIASTQLRENEDELAQCKAKIAAQEREQERSVLRQARDREPSASPEEAEIEALEGELDDANKEIAKLTALLQASPARKAIDAAKEARIQMLEREREDLMETVKNLRSTVKDLGTPSRVVNASASSPHPLQGLSLHARTPKTPGGPLRDLSWLNHSSTDPTVAPFVAEISRLQRELERANESIDDKLDRLEEAGLGVVGLTKKLEDARSRISALEEEISRLSRRDDRRARRLERLRCRKCHIKLDIGGFDEDPADESSMDVSVSDILPSEPPTPPTRTSENLRANIQSLNVHLDALKAQSLEQKRNLEIEKATLQETANRLNLQVHSAKGEIKRAAENERVVSKRSADTEGELEQAKKTITDLENDLKEERSRLRALMVQQTKAHRDKDDIQLQLKRMESDMDDVKQELQVLKHENHNLEAELRANANADQKARLLEGKVMANAETIEQLREERSILAKEHKTLQRRFAEISEHANQLREQHAASQASHDSRRHQLDRHLAEVEELRRALSDRADELQRTEEEKARIASEKSDVAQAVAVLEADLRRVKRDAEAFGRDLKTLRAEKEKMETVHKDETSAAERARKQAQAQIRVLNERLEVQQDRAKVVEEQLERHVCSIGDRELAAMKLQHKQECKGLIVQIRYLKSKFTRESNRWCMVVAQKDYVMTLLARFEQSERNILVAIARIGFPAPPPLPSKRSRSLKSVVFCVLFTLYAKRASKDWKAQSSSKELVVAALHEVRRKRIQTS